MAHSGTRRALILLCLLVQAASRRAGTAASLKGKSAVTPVEKVIELLKKVQAQVEEEGLQEAAQYDKYSCFCKEQLDSKVYAIEKSEERITKLNAEINVLNTDIASHSAEVSAQCQEISRLTDIIGNETAARDAEHATYVESVADIKSAIDCAERAIAALKDSRSSLSGKVDFQHGAHSALLQFRAAAGRALRLAQHQQKAQVEQTAAQLSLLSDSSAGGQPGEVNQYSYHSTDIIALLQKLRKDFIAFRDRLDQDEFEARSMFDSRVLSLEHDKAAAEKIKEEQEKFAAYKTELLNTADAERANEMKERLADKRFLEVLRADCQEKAQLWDQRSQTRTAELAAIAKALEVLKTGVVPNWGANRRLVGLQKGVGKKTLTAAASSRKQPRAAEPNEVARTAPAHTEHQPSFLQLHGTNAHDGQALKKRAVALLSEAAHRLRSPVLSVAELKLRVSEDHFVKVRSLIKDLIARLEAEKLAEASTKQFCDTEMKAAVETRDVNQRHLEELEAGITGREASKALLTDEVQELSATIARNKKELAEATQLRAEERQDNQMVMGKAQAGKEAVEFALNLLKEFYNSADASLAQRAGYVPPNSDREGNTVSDLAPEVFSGKYSGKQDASSGIIGLLEVILADFERTGSTVAWQEEQYEADFQHYKMANDANTQATENLKAATEAEVEKLSNEVMELTDTKGTTQNGLDLAHKQLDKLAPMCVAAEETYEERVAKRAKEIEALKEAHAILEEWQG